MKKILSVSLGTSTRDHKVETNILGEKFFIERIGTNGNIHRAIEILKENDGKVDAFGMGGIDFYLQIGYKKHFIKDALPLKNAPKVTPIVDGSGLKNTLEKKIIKQLKKEGAIDFQKKKVLLTSAADRFGMAETLKAVGSDLIYGDLMFGLGIPYPIKSLSVFCKIANLIAPFVTKMPFHMLYPIGKKQEQYKEKKLERFYQQSDIIAGDFHYIRRFMPKNMQGKMIITNTVTQADVEEIRKRGVVLLVTTTPGLMGRSFGTNVMEAVFVALLDMRLDEIRENYYWDLIQLLSLKPRILYLSRDSSIKTII